MIVSFFLCISSRGSIKTSKNAPRLNSDEVSMKVDLNIPNQIFKKPALSATIKIPESSVSQPDISAEIVDNIQEAIKQSSGLDVTLNVVHQ